MASGELTGARILVVDDDEATLRLVHDTFEGSGAEHVTTLTDPRRVAEVQPGGDFDLLVVDVRMPHMDGIEVVRSVRQRATAEEAPVLVMSGAASRDERNDALASGAQDFVEKPFDSSELVLRASNLVKMHRLHRSLRLKNEELEERVRERTEDLEMAQVEILERLARVSEYHDSTTGGHIQRVARLTELLALEVGLEEGHAELLSRAAMLHDVGKIAVPWSIQTKPGQLSKREFERVKEHALIGAELLSGSQFEVLKQAEAIARSHHEWWNGEGYSEGLRGEEIPLAARLVAVADVFDALTHQRHYKEAWPLREAHLEIEQLAGKQFDPHVVRGLQRLFERGELVTAL